MKLRSHWQLLCQFKRQFMRQRVGEGDQQGRVYRAGLAVQKASMSSTDGCTVHSLAFDRPGARAGQERRQARRTGRAGSACEKRSETLGSHLECPSGVQVALGGHFEEPSGVQVALGEHLDGVQVRLGGQGGLHKRMYRAQLGQLGKL